MANSNQPKAQIAAEMDASGVRPGFEAIKRDAKDLGTTLKQAGDQGAAAFKAIEEGAKATAGSMSRVESSIIGSITRATNKLQQAGKSASEAFAFKIETKGLDPAKFEPSISKLREAEAAARAFQDRLKSDDAARAAVASQQAFIAGLREQIALYGKSADEVQRYRAAQLGIADAAAPLILQLQNQKAAQEAAAKAARDEAQAQRDAATAKQTAARQQQAFIASLQDQVALQGKTQAEVLRYRAAQLGVSKDAETYISQLERANKATGNIGVSAGQTAAALRQLPAQFTDVVTSLQAGQAPLTVLLQQGSQIKDSFGGAGAALKATAGYIASLIGPVTIAVGAVGALAFAYKAGANEDAKFRQTLILTGNSVGTTADALSTMSARIGAIAGNQGKAADVLNALAESGKVGAESLERFALAAIKMERASGPAAEKTVAAFASLAEKPADAARKLNESTNFLTANLYKQIKALEDQGRTTDAARVAQEAYATALEERAPKMEATLGLVEKAWRGVKEATLGAWEAMKSVGRDTTLEDQIKRVEAQLKVARAAAANEKAGAQAAPTAEAFFRNLFDGDSFGKQATELEKLLERLKVSKDLADGVAKSTATATEAEKARVQWLADGDKYLSKQQQAAREIAALRQQFKTGFEGRNDEQAAQARLELEQRIVAIRAKYADQGGDNELASLRARLKETNAYIAALGQQGAATRELNEGEKKAAELREQLKDNLSATTRAEKERALAVAVQLGQRQRLADSLKSEIELTAKAAQQAGEQADAIRERAAQQEAANAVFGQGKTAIEELTLAEFKKQARDLEATDNVDPKYLANLYAKIDAQKKLVSALGAADYKQINQASQEWLRNATEAARLQAEEPAMLALSAAQRQLINDNRATDLKLAKELDALEKSGLTTAQQAAEAEVLRSAAAQERARNETAASQAALRDITDFLDPSKAQDFGTALSNAFEGAGNSLAKLSNSLADYARQQQAVAKQQQNIALIENPAEKQAAQLKLNEKSQQNQISLYASLTGAAKGFFNEGSKGYKALAAAETAFRIVQIASNLQQGLSAAALAIANQGKGDPYTAFPRMAAMAAAMAALGFAVGWSSGGTQSGGDGGQVATGTGTVLGDSSAKSDSIGKSIDRLADTAKLQLTTQSGMLSALRNIENSIGGLSSLIVRTGNGDLTTGKSFGIDTSVTAPVATLLSGGLNKLADSLGLGKLTQVLFGNSTKITGTGLNLPTQSLAQAINGSQLQQYVDTYSSKKFLGITYSSKSGTQYSAADAQLSQQFTQVFRDLYSGVLQASAPLGQAFDQVKARLDGFVLSVGKIDLQGLNGKEIQEKLSAVIGAAADNIAQAAIPGLQDFEKVGEGYFETLVRVASGVEQAKASLANLGITAVNFADVVRKQGDVAAEIVRQSITKAESTAGQTISVFGKDVTLTKLSSVGQLIDQLDGSADDLINTYKALVDVRDVLISVGESGDSLTAALIQGAGGLDNLKTSLQTYLQGSFFTDQERAAAAMASLQQQFARIGVTQVPQTSAQFRALVESIDLSTESGQRFYAQVIGLAGAFDSAQNAAQKASQTVANTRLADILKSQAAEQNSVMVDLLKAQGDTAGAAALKRQQDLATLTAGLTDAEKAAAIAGYDYIASLRAQIDATNTASQAAAAEAQRLAAVANERKGLETQLLELQGDTTELRRRELEALDPTNRAIKEHIYALQDEKTAADAAASAASAVASERLALENQILQLTGNTAEIRKRELEALDPTNRSLQERIYALQDEQAAQQAAEQAARDAAQAAEELRQAWQSVTDGLLEEVKRIRGTDASNSPKSLAEAQARFAIATGQARAGDQDAAKLLPSLSQALLALAQAQASSSTELDILRSKTAASLSSTAALLARQFGLTLPKFDVGTNYVPQDMAAIVHKGEAIVPRAYNPALAGGGDMQRLTVAVEGLREDQRVQASTADRRARDQYKLFKQWDQDGLPQERDESATA